jgi:plastocyanin
MRSPRLAAAGGAVLLTLVVAACGSSEGPGWTYQPAASVTPAPSTAASGEPSPGATPTVAPSAGGEPSGSAPASGEPSASAGALTVVAQNIAFEQKELEAPADTAFQITLDNRENVPHDVDIRGSDGQVIVDNQPQTTTGQVTYDIDALAAGDYEFFCSIHPIPAMTGTLTVQ